MQANATAIVSGRTDMLLSRAMRSATDLLMRPQIRDFVYLRVLRMGETNLLNGARHAASAVQSAVEASLTDGDNNALDSMLHAGNLASPLHAALLDECTRGRETEGAVELMLEELSRQRQTIKEGTARVESLLLIAGAQRRVAAGGLAGLHRMRIGSHLLVVDTSPDGLYGVERQRELMLARGCCVQVGVSFIGSGGLPPQSYLFEANVDGDTLALPALDAADSDGVDVDDDGLEVMVADLNGMTGGRFWQQAARVPSWVDPEVG